MGEPNEAARRIAPLLGAGEHLLWVETPSAGGLFFANLGRVLTDLVWSALTIFAFVYAIQTRSATGFAASGVMLAVFVPSLWDNLRTAFGARHILYAITDQRIIRHDDRDKGPFVVQRHMPEHMTGYWLDGRAKRGWRRGGRATLKIRYRGYMGGTMRSGDGYQSRWLKLPATTDADEAVALLNHERRA